MPRENLNDLVAFLTVARERSFTRAAARLGVSQSALSHTLRGMESRLGVRLLNRSTRSVAPTQAGERLFQSLGPKFEEIDAELAALNELREKPAGLVRITTVEHAAQTILWPKLAPLLRNYPDIKIEISIDYGLTDIVADRFDAGVRHGEAVAKDMIAVPIGPPQRIAVAGTPGYFASHPIPKTPQDLLSHDCINLRLPTLGNFLVWEFEKDGQSLNVHVEGQLVFNMTTSIMEACLQGFGLAYLPDDILQPAIIEGRLVRVLDDWCQPYQGYHLYYPSRRQQSPAFNLVVEALRYRGGNDRRPEQAATPEAAADPLAPALRHHQDGRLDEAETLYRVLLAANPDHAGALHLLGVLACQKGRHAEAADLIGRAVAIDGNVAAFHSNLGVALRELKRTEEAEAAFRRAAALAPDYAEAWSNLGTALEELDRFEEAEDVCRRAVALKPEHAEAHLNLGSALMGQARHAEAAESYRRAIALKPRYAKAHCSLGVALRALGEAEESMRCYGRALMIDPAYAEAHLNLSNLLRVHGRHQEALGAAEETVRLKPESPLALLCLGNALDALGRHEDAAGAFRRAVALKPDFAEAHSNLGNSLKELGRLDEAEAACRAAIALKPDKAQSHSNLGNVFKERNRLPQALACYERALACEPDFAQGRLNRGITHLLMGNYEQGWPDYEWRWKFEDWPQKPRYLGHPLWRGEPAQGRTILVWPEQGIGDQIHFCRYVPRLAEAGWTVVLETPKALLRLFSRLPGVARVVPFGAELPPFDRHCPMMSLAAPFGPAQDFAGAPYLSPDPQAAEQWRRRLDALPGLKVGLAWRGNPKMRRDRNRSLPASAFAWLGRIPGLVPVILQKDLREDELAALRLSGPHLVAAPALEDFADTAALTAHLDLVISVDTAVCHLAGALGRPVWTLLEFAPDWRWGLEREDCLWYPSMRLFRQKAAGDWTSPLKKLRRAANLVLTGQPVS